MLKHFFYIPEPAAAHAGAIDSVIENVHWVMLVLFVGWMAFFLYTLFRFRRSRQPRADYTGARSHVSTWLEVAVAVVEVVLLVGFSIPLWADRVDRRPPETEAVVVRAVAEQFAWNFHYPGPDGKFGRTDPAKIDLQTNPLGLDRSDAAAKDDITTVNQLFLPVNRPAIVHLSSKDVIHSFNLPHMRSKQDAVPGLDIPLWFVPTVTTAEMRAKLHQDDFQYEIACAQLCGLGHYRMRGFLTVETAEGYDKWLADQAAQLVGTGEGGDFWQ
jgi:cytochrome c oxidase subunit II